MDYALSGAFAALATPIHQNGSPDYATFERLIDFVVERQVDGVVIGGGTGEYIHLAPEDRRRLLELAIRRVGTGKKVIASVGTSSIHSTREIARAAADLGSDLLLIPMPYFFRYEQEDLAAYCRAVCEVTPLPCLLYNLPSFTNPILPETAISLFQTVPNLVGMKDSSGKTENLSAFAQARNTRPLSLLVGDDSLLFSALEAGWDGVISGIASFAPELIVGVYRTFREGRKEEAKEKQKELDEVIDEIVRLPIPWGVRVGLAARGIANGPLPLPLSPNRTQQVAQLTTWLGQWAKERERTLDAIWA